MDISNWVIFSSLVTAAGVVIALWQGVRNRNYTNQLMAAEQRKQASLLRVGPATVRLKEPGVAVGPDGRVPVMADYIVENASDEVFTEIWTLVTFSGGSPARQTYRAGLVFLPAKFKQTVSCEFTASPGPGPAEFRVPLSTTFTDARDVRWRLDERHRLHRANNNEGITGEASEIVGGNDDAPVIFQVSAPPTPPPDGASTNP